MANTFGELSKQFRELAATLPIRANQAKQVLASTVDADLLRVTPVDTGQAVSNWQVTLDTPATEPIPAYAPAHEGYMKQTKGVKAWTHKAPPEVTRQANAAPASEAARTTIQAAQPGQPIYITNPLDYIELLDQGHSSQAPALFVDRAIILGRDVLSRVRITD
jgi:hypothetical protein